MTKPLNNTQLTPELIEAFGRFAAYTNPVQLHRYCHRMMHDYILNDEHPDDEYIRNMVMQMGELFPEKLLRFLAPVCPY